MAIGTIESRKLRAMHSALIGSSSVCDTPEAEFRVISRPESTLNGVAAFDNELNDIPDHLFTTANNDRYFICNPECGDGNYFIEADDDYFSARRSFQISSLECPLDCPVWLKVLIVILYIILFSFWIYMCCYSRSTKYTNLNNSKKSSPKTKIDFTRSSQLWLPAVILFSIISLTLVSLF